eukprot:CAMPEP_0170487642 /NCGR_PEP_ID=MMETSP0208-20121228/6412_1 /TAXON_ID=197538 /ORGANISM="Strombidium inclinatum, Strain S3" /LENGTH=174 /DNA_ID=CAMNT_0010761995 /DNA_START=369 /DNA_END=893 /DNA_ORIENTATION=+
MEGDKEEQRQEILELNEKRENIEKEMATIVEVLNGMQGAPGLQDRLTDDEGFPRADVDIMECRKLRNRHACLQTDHSKLMKEIEQRMFALHSIFKAQGCVDEPSEKRPAASLDDDGDQIMEKTGSEPAAEEKEKPKEGEKIPFVWIHDVVSGSPAEQDGLKIGDGIFRFGSVSH